MDIQKDGYIGYGTINPQTIIHIVQSNVTITLEDPRNDINSSANIEFKNGSGGQNSDWKLSSSNSFFNIASVSNNTCNILSLNSSGNIIVEKDIVIGGNIVKNGENIDISKIHTSNITNGVLLVQRGGTGLNILQPNQIIVGNGINPPIQSPNLFWNNTTNTLTTSNINALTFSGIGSNIIRINANNIETGTINTLRLPVATTSTIGAIKKGDNINIADDGTISINLAYYNGYSTINGDLVVNSNLIVHGTSTTLNTDVYTTERLEITNGGTANTTFAIKQTAVDNTNNILNVTNSSTSNVFNVSSGGNVGIGITNPTSKLHIMTTDTAATTTNLLDFRNAGNYGIYATSIPIGLRGNTLDFLTRDYNNAATLQIRNILSLRPEGNVGIGITNPSELLHVNGIIKTEGTIISGTDILSSNHIYTTSSTGRLGIGINPNMPTSSHIHLHRNSVNTEIKLQFTDGTTSANTTNGLALYKGSDQNGYLWNYENNAIILGTNNIERLRILNNGNVGIGTNTGITERLVVSGNAQISGTISGNGSLITNINAGNITTGTLPVGRGGIGSTTLTATQVLVGDGANPITSFSGLTWTNGTNTLTATNITGTGSNITNINANNISSGTIERLRLPLATSAGAVGAVKKGNNINIDDGTISIDLATYNGHSTINGDLVVNSNLIVHGTSTTLNTDVYTTERLEVTNSGTINSTLTIKQTAIGNANNILNVINSATSNVFNVSSSGNTGIGTTNPINRLHLHNTTANSDVSIRFTDATSGAGATNGFVIGENSTQKAYLWNYGNTDMLFATNNAERMTISSTGNIGIGTTLNTAGVLLDVNGIIESRTSVGANNTFYFKGVANSDLSRVTIAGQYSTGSAVNDTILRSTNKLVLQSGVGAASIIIDTANNVGIGITNPQTTLDVNGNLLIRAFGNSGNGTKGIFFRPDFVTANLYNCSILTFDHNLNGSSDGLSINAYDGVSFCSGSNTRNERMRISENGNVGIGTINPQRLLHIQNNMRIGGSGPVIDFGDNMNVQIYRPVTNNELSFTTSGIDRFRITDNGINFQNNVWHSCLNSNARFNFASNATTYIRGHGTSPIEFRNGVDSTILKISSTGVLDTYSNINIPLGSKYKINGQDLAFNNLIGIIPSSNLPTAGTGITGALGGVKVDGSSITIDTDGRISASSASGSKWALLGSDNIYKVSGNVGIGIDSNIDEKLIVNGNLKIINGSLLTSNIITSNIITSNITTNIVNAQTISGAGSNITNIKAGNITSGTIDSLRLPIATSSVLGVVKKGNNINIVDGTISVDLLSYNGDSTINGNLVVNSNLIIHGTSTTLNTEVYTTERLDITNAGANSTLTIKQTASGNTSNILNVINSSSTNVFNISSMGNVGIGTTNPTSKLHIATPDVATPFALLDFRNNGNFGIYATSQSVASRGNTLDFLARDYNLNGTIATRNVLSLTPEGNVGIGITNPTQLLTLNNGNILLTGLWNSSSKYNIQCINTDKRLEFDNVNGTGLFDNNRITFNVNNQQAMNILTNGNVGIGKTAGYKLDVNGDVNATDIRIGGTSLNTTINTNNTNVSNYVSTTSNILATDFIARNIVLDNKINTNNTNVSNYVSTTSNILLADFVARDGVLTTDYIARDVVLDTKINTTSNILLADFVARDGALTTDYIARDVVLDTKINTTSNILLADFVARDGVLTTDYIARDVVLDTKINTTSNILLADFVARDGVLTTDYIARDVVLDTKINTTSNILLADFVARDAVLNNAITTNAYSDLKVLTYLGDITTKTIGGILQVGVSSGGGIIKLGGTAEDIGFDLATIQNRDYVSGKSEIVIFKGNDIEGTSGADRIRLRAGAIAFDTYLTTSTSAITQSIRMYIDGTGNVGIGTTNPDNILTIRTTTSTARLRLVSSSSTGNAFIRFMKSDGNTLGYDIGYEGATTNNLQFIAYNNTTTGRIDMQIARSTGNVGIGTAPHDTYKLDVNGSINIPLGSTYKINSNDLAFSNLIGIVPPESLPIAGTGAPGAVGGVKVDGSSITITPAGIISASSASGSKWTLSGTDNIYKVSGNVGIGIDSNLDEKLIVNGNLKITNGSLLTSNIITNILNAQTISGAGSNITRINANNISDGTIDSLRLPLATSSVLGVVKKGNNINIVDGAISVDLLSYNGDSTINGNLVVNSNLIIHGISTTLNTDVYTTERLDITNAGANSTLTIKQTASGNTSNILNVINSSTSNVFNISSTGAVSTNNNNINSGTGTITAATFSGALNGNATTATNAYGLIGIPNISVGAITGSGQTNQITNNTDAGVELGIRNNSTGASAYTAIMAQNAAGSSCVMFLNSSTRTLDGGANTATLRNDAGDLRLSAALQTPFIYLNKTSVNVGIGTETPANYLHLHKNAASQDIAISLTDTTTGATSTNGLVVRKDSNSIGYLWNYANSPLLLGTNNAERIRIAANGAVGIQNGSATAIINNYMTGGSLAIGNINSNYGGGTGSWNTNTAGLLMECLDNTEFAVHDVNNSLHSFMRYTTDGNFTIGRNMGHGVANVTMPGSLSVTGNVGIDKTAVYKLDVNGDVNATDIRIGGVSLNTTINTNNTNVSNFVSITSNNLINNVRTEFYTKNHIDSSNFIKSSELPINIITQPILNTCNFIRTDAVTSNFWKNVKSTQNNTIYYGAPVKIGGSNTIDVGNNYILEVLGNVRIKGTITQGWIGDGSTSGDGGVLAPTIFGSGSEITNLNANNITLGTLPVTRGGIGTTSLTATQLLVGDGTNPVTSFSGLTWVSGTNTLIATNITGAGSNITNINANNITLGTLPVTRGGIGTTSLTATQLLVGDGTNPVTSFSGLTWVSGTNTLIATNITGAGSNITNINANNITLGTLPVTRGGIGTTSLMATQLLVGDGTNPVTSYSGLTWVSGTNTLIATNITGAGSNITNINAGNITTGNIDSLRLPTATTSDLGGVKVDGTTITINSSTGVISGVNTYVLPVATQAVLGGVKKGNNINIVDGTISVDLLSYNGDSTINGNLVVNSNLIIHGTSTTLNTEVYTTERLDITNAGANSTLTIKQTASGNTSNILNVINSSSTNVFNVSSGGNVIIGSAANSSDDNNPTITFPDSTFYVRGPRNVGSTTNITFRGGLEGNNNGKVKIWLASDTSHSSYIENEHVGSGNTDLMFGTSSGNTLPVERMRIVNNGNVGIGTNNPTARLHVHNTTANSDVGIRFTDSTSGASATNGFAIGENSTQQAYLLNYGNTDMLFSTNSTERLRILANGNVGIGTNNPTTLLDVVSASPIVQIRTTAGGAGKIYFGNSSHGVGRGPSVGTILDANDVSIWTAGTGSVAFATNSTERFRIAVNGSISTINNNLTAGTGTITAATFSGALSGNATTATNASGLTGTPNISVGTINTTSITNTGNWSWAPGTDYKLNATANTQEWSFDLMNQNTYTGCHWQVWSDKTGLGTILACRGDTGFVGIGTNPSAYRLTVQGDIAASADIIAYYSDERLKHINEYVKDVLPTLSKINVFKYNCNDLAASYGFDKSKNEIGLSAQEIKKYYPELVVLAPFDTIRKEGSDINISKSGEDYLTLKYERLVPILLQGIKELKEENNLQKKEIDDLKQENNLQQKEIDDLKQENNLQQKEIDDLKWRLTRLELLL